jgi:hypothetical protein
MIPGNLTTALIINELLSTKESKKIPKTSLFQAVKIISLLVHLFFKTN